MFPFGPHFELAETTSNDRIIPSWARRLRLDFVRALDRFRPVQWPFAVRNWPYQNFNLAVVNVFDDPGEIAHVEPLRTGQAPPHFGFH
jgi:hypothetical protein